METKFLALGLSLCLALLSFYEVSCQDEGTAGLNLDLIKREYQAARAQKMLEEIEREFEEANKAATTKSILDEIKREFEAATSGLKQLKINSYTVQDDDKEQSARRQSMLDAAERKFEAVSHSFKQLDDLASNKDEGDQYAKRNSMFEAIEREFEAARRGLAEIKNYEEQGAMHGEPVEAFQHQMKATASSKTVVVEEIPNEKTKLETRGTTFQAYLFMGVGSTDDESDIHQIYYGSSNDEKESEKNPGSSLFGNEASSMESRLDYELKTSSSGLGVMGSLGTGPSGAWRCFNQDKNGVRGDDSIIIPKYELHDIIKEESIKGSSSKTSSLMTSLTEIVDNHKKGRWTDVKLGKVSTTETSEKVKKLKAILRKYVGIKVRDLVARWDYDEILTMAALYEELTKAPVTYISRLSTYGTVIKEGFNAYQQAKTVHQRVILHENVATEKQKRVDAEFELVKDLAQKGDNLAVQIFAMKKAVMKLEDEKKQVGMEFQKTVVNLSRVLENSSHAYEKRHLVVREWKEVQASAEYSLETIEKADVVWVQFLNTL